MNRFRTALLVASLVLPGLAAAQSAPERHTGDAWVDRQLADIDAYAATYRDAFVDEMARYHRAPRELVDALLARPAWSPGDVYYACGIAEQAGRPCRSVADLRAADPTPAWNAVAHAVGVAPGTPGFHAFKRGIVATYDRWARPVRLDAELAPDFPQRPHEARPAPAREPSPAPGTATSKPPAPPHGR